MKIEFADLVLLNDELKKLNSRYHIDYKNETTARTWGLLKRTKKQHHQRASSRRD